MGALVYMCLASFLPSVFLFISSSFPSFKSHGFSELSPTSPKFLKFSGISPLSSALFPSSSSLSDSTVLFSVSCRLIRSCSERACRDYKCEIGKNGEEHFVYHLNLVESLRKLTIAKLSIRKLGFDQC